MTTAVDLGWTLWAYDAVIEASPGQDPAGLLTMEFTNWREREQAQNLCRVLAAAPGEPLLAGRRRDRLDRQRAQLAARTGGQSPAA